MKSPTYRILAMSITLIAGLALGACTRSANPTVVPAATTPAPDGGVAGGAEGYPVDGQNATMAAIGTGIASQMTATAAAVLQPGGATPVPPTAINPTAVVATPLPITATPIPVGCSNPYTVKQGDWIYKIARDCGVEPSAIIALNPGINPNRIVPGQLLNMPPAGATAVPPATSQACIGTYTVRTGDNLFRIAYNCGLTTEGLAAFNGIPFPYTIYVGQLVRFP